MGGIVGAVQQLIQPGACHAAGDDQTEGRECLDLPHLRLFELSSPDLRKSMRGGRQDRRNPDSVIVQQGCLC
jgi:hypothetical protein